MATASIYNDDDSKTSWGAWTKYFSFPISTINSALNNTSNVPANAKITGVTINVSVRYEVSGSAKVYFKYGIGGNGSISNELLSENQIGSTSSKGSETQSKALPIGSSLSPFSISTANGDYFTICIYTSNNLPKTFWVDSVTLDIAYHTHSHTSTVTKQPTCETAGETTYTCSCGDSYVDKTKPEALGHSWDTEYIWAEDTKTGYWYCLVERICNRSGCAASDAASGNVTRSVKIPATCTEMGTTSHTATFDVDWATTQVKDVQDIPAKGHTWVDATCTAPKTCSVCGATEGSALGHSYTSAITKQPTCTEKGIKTFTCQHDSSHKYTEEVAPLGHDYVKTEVAPTTTTDGYDNYVCSRCGDSYQNNYTCLYTVKCNSECGTVSGGGTHSKGANVTISATPNEGWYVAGWKLNGIELTHLAGINSFNEIVDKSKEYEVFFAKIPPKITSVKMLYQNKQISETNKVLTDEFFRIVVSVE